MTPTSVLRGGLVYDGLGNAPVPADVGIAGSRIVEVGHIPGGVAQELDVTGLVVAPGFINVLSHAWQSIQLDGSCPSDLVQGVTTEVFGEGESLGPSDEVLVSSLRASGALQGADLGFATLGEGLDHVERLGASVNVASFIGGSNLRCLGAGLEDRPLTDAELEHLCQLVDAEMSDGALGIATALIYAPGSFASTDELARLCEVVGQHDGLYISHMRSEGDQFLESLEELISIGSRAKCRVEAYHLKAGGSHNHFKMVQAIERIQAARDAGQHVSADMYPYTAAGTALVASIPARYHAGGTPALLERLSQPDERAQIVRDLEGLHGGFENLFLGADQGRGILLCTDMADGTPSAGKFLPEVSALLGIPSLAETLVEIVRRDVTMMACYFVMSEANVRLGLEQPWVSIGSDAAAVAADTSTDTFTHPRAFGSFARILGHYSRDLRLFPLEEAIRKMTSLPADTLRLKDRGRIVPGAWADIAVFDPQEVDDPATFDNPRALATGMHHVLVNGEPVLADGEIVSARPGRRLRRNV